MGDYLPRLIHVLLALETDYTLTECTVVSCTVSKLYLFCFDSMREFLAMVTKSNQQSGNHLHCSQYTSIFIPSTSVSVTIPVKHLVGSNILYSNVLSVSGASGRTISSFSLFTLIPVIFAYQVDNVTPDCSTYVQMYHTLIEMYIKFWKLKISIFGYR